ncbi:hypothetical protein [Campylobacter troglodytis]|uniref:hypothetical protein n=1 Tax=Campylobacter troglodytis TaxID=654363 RepID=UPI001FE7D33B|nr:hypothetical protein [Campylobacter troglodytis]
MAEFSQLDLIMEFFKANPGRDISHQKLVDWVSNEWQKRTGKVFRDPDRGIRSLHLLLCSDVSVAKRKMRYLQKIAKGVYRYEPELVVLRKDLEDFSPTLKKQILERDNYKCVICGLGKGL